MGEQPPERIRRRLAEVFGDVLPAVTRDELEPGAEHRHADASECAWRAPNAPCPYG